MCDTKRSNEAYQPFLKTQNSPFILFAGYIIFLQDMGD